MLPDPLLFQWTGHLYSAKERAPFRHAKAAIVMNVTCGKGNNSVIVYLPCMWKVLVQSLASPVRARKVPCLKPSRTCCQSVHCKIEQCSDSGLSSFLCSGDQGLGLDGMTAHYSQLSLSPSLALVLLWCSISRALTKVQRKGRKNQFF